MHTLDIIFLIMSSVFIIIGIKRGLIGEIIRLSAMIGGFIVAFLYYPDVSAYLPLARVPLSIKNGISFLVVYIIVALIIIALGWGVKRIVHLTVLGWVDRVFGAAIGFFKAAMIAWVFCLSISSFPVERVENNLTKSLVYRTYKNLPHTIKLNNIIKYRSTLKKLKNEDSSGLKDTIKDRSNEIMNKIKK